MIKIRMILRRMYGTKTKEEITQAYTSAHSGEYYPSKIIPAGYSGLIRGSIYRDIDGMEIVDDTFLEQPIDELIQSLSPMEKDVTLGMYLFYTISRHFACQLNYNYRISDSYNWDVNVSSDHGICISFFLPEKVGYIPIMKFQHESEDYYIEFSGDSEPSSQENDEDYDY